jgi:Ca2+-binding RTX toxin-like protein
MPSREPRWRSAGSREPAAYRAALELYAGDLLPRDRYEEWTEERRTGLRRTYLALLLELAALHEERGDFGRAIDALREVISSEPAHVSLMRVYARTGQRYQALRQYEHLHQVLRRELGTEPNAASRHAYEEISAGHVPVAGPHRPEQELPEAGKHNLPGSLTSFVGRRQLTATPVAEEEPTWSPYGSQIAFAGKDPNDSTATDLEIWAINADGSGLTQLTDTANGVRDTQPAWSPDGTQIAFLSEGLTDDNNSDIYVMDTNPATDGATNLTPDDTTTTPVYQWNDEDPSWSPDGTQITYSTIQDVWKMNANGTGKTNLTLGSGGGSQPAWSPDGSSIVYVRADGTDRNIYVMDTNGGNKTPVDTTQRSDVKPDWQPNPPACDITGTNGDNTLPGTTADETICGLGGNDVLGGGGNDILMGGDGNDTLTSSASGRATIDGAAGKDTASFAASATSIEASLITNFAQRVGTTPLEGVALVGIENLTGSGFGDVLTGSGAANKLVGGDGADELLGLGGKNRINSRDGLKNDTVNCGRGAEDVAFFDRGTDSVSNCEIKNPPVG